jgi:hypothetical protein
MKWYYFTRKRIHKSYSKVIAELVDRKVTHQQSVLTTSNAKYHCGYCCKDSHTEDRCYKKKRDKGSAAVRHSNLTETALCNYETALIVRAKNQDM